MSACTGTRVPTNTGVPPRMSGSERTTDGFFMARSLSSNSGMLVDCTPGLAKLADFGKIGNRRSAVREGEKIMSPGTNWMARPTQSYVHGGCEVPLIGDTIGAHFDT